MVGELEFQWDERLGPVVGIGVADSVVKSMPADWDYGAYANYVEDKLDNWEQLYFGNHYDRLKSIKDSYDPYGVFTFPTSIED
ncbi:glucooligosaccharide oxidase [Moniliophthora roreri]|nr:glucooligosaccharide oxidase [Moniliophthora roreri]